MPRSTIAPLVALTLMLSVTGVCNAAASEKDGIMRGILLDLADNAPHVSINLEGGTHAPADETFVRAGILRFDGWTKAKGTRPAGRMMLSLTERGQAIAGREGWFFDDETLEIVVGRLAFVKGSYRIQDLGEGKGRLSYRWRYLPNENLRYLLAIAPIAIWPTTIMPSCVFANGRSRNKEILRNVPAMRDVNGKWTVVRGSLAERGDIVGC